MKTNTGKKFELLVELIERSISSNSRVERDVRLPVLASLSGNKEQCDVIIRTGNPPRETLTLIEVQDRKSRVKPNEFRGWLKKLQDVGAQHLICVSRQPFPESIKEEAVRQGGTVRLINIKQLGIDEIPFALFDFNNFKFTFNRFSLVALHSFIVGVEKEHEHLANEIGEIYAHEANGFSFDQRTTLSLGDLCNLLIKNDGFESNSGRTVYRKEPHSSPFLYYRIRDEFVRVGVEFEFEWRIDPISLPISAFSYEQLDHGSLAWVLEAAIDSPDGMVAMKVPLVKSGDSLMFNGLMIDSPFDGFVMDFSVNNELRERFIYDGRVTQAK